MSGDRGSDPPGTAYPAGVQDYELIARLGRGGMGVVDLARDPHGNRVAIKRLTLHGSAGDIMRARQRLLREAEVLRRLQHPNIVRLLDVIEDEDEIVLVMPYLNGGNLAERVSQHGPAPVREVERLAQRLLGALATAHAKGIIHRDIKPANVLFDERGEPCLADFGVAHTWDQTGGLTVAGMVVGTPGFMAPEQARDEQLTPASDVFALGATLLYAATATGPYGSGDPGLLMVRAADGKVERISKSVPTGLRRRLRAMLNPRPERRPTAAALLTGDLSALRRPPPRFGAAARPMGAAAGRARSSRTGPALAFAAFAGVVLVVAVTVSTGQDDSPPSGTADGASTDDEAPAGTGGDAGVAPDGSDGESPSDDAEDDSLLVDDVRGSLDPGDPQDTFRIPVGDGSPCPQQVALTLTTEQEVDLLLTVVRTAPDGSAETLVSEAETDEGTATVVFRPANCPSPESAYRARLVPVGDALGTEVDYRITRDDS
ncbi:MAG: serine/threonine-protein kinase [Acidimicrobiales bacterium]